ncbi:endo-1,3;1,4-beta-D-glucanase-like [Diospyros lotus]|uniref:endo-1,3;1,4-beta-D-glucanase-like n=1 Tax=Diospyros lotus TaxID=55363 RepID=UPI00225209BA|nr:endo-1,3;1,4-beta-D-glucanase-like [Diospyros lotus]
MEDSDSECCKNPPTLSSSAGSGSLVEIGGLNAYVAGSSHSKLGIIMGSDIFGYEAPKLRKMADKVAAAGFFVVVPDFFYGDPWDPADKERSFKIWMQTHGTDKATIDAKSVIAALKNKGISAIGAAGFCWGGKVAVNLAKTDYIQAAVLLHPSLVTVDDIKEVQVPIAVLGAEFDRETTPQLLKQFAEILSSKPEISSYVKVYPGVGHGWTIRYKDDDEKAIKAAEEAYHDMLNWFIKYVKQRKASCPWFFICC